LTTAARVATGPTLDFDPRMSATAVLLEREAEVGRVDAALAAAREGRGRALLVEGPAGIGKTALLETARRRAEGDGMLCSQDAAPSSSAATRWA
jgi:MoxR-like ATPase